MPETSQKVFRLPGESGGIVIRWRAWGASFLKICILDIFGNILSNLSLDRCQKPPKKFFDSQGGQGGQGDSFLIIYILGIFGDISSNLSLDRCQKSPKNFFDSQGGQGGKYSGRTVGGASFLKLCIHVIFGDIS